MSDDADSAYARDGYVLVRGLFSREEAADWYAHAHHLGATRTAEFASAQEFDPTSEDPLRRRPRLLQPHLGDERSRQFLLDQRLRRALVHLLGEEPLAVQTMIYFKPPGARGQALHQDQRYLQVSPGTCVAAWLALERVDPANGCLRVVPGSHRVGVLCPVPSDTTRSFTSETVPVPEGMSVVDVVMEPGDVLFFHGNLIHGSDPNTTADRFRTVVVGHYATGGAERISQWYPDVVSFAGQPAPLDAVPAGGPCGEFVDGEFIVTSTVREALARH
ncbi:phytanoyl-CoA dioxygenase family protein [Kineococcus rhizosphaerae]|uniref:Phytanoyl-CoA dioxygenase PhyH n=1 Tax=Kineococcus rhizosphaerae TaxID=559628 RepID=A0A2T0R0J9_9ACTN|nr:phytanoyl-CoA dioxygenase family protein [Kineococcus rhizosphaerae]PRY12598.1 phytanoyl-CoA dioxygenase PhyH [Kineococcus rhizosphaerae]